MRGGRTRLCRILFTTPIAVGCGVASAHALNEHPHERWDLSWSLETWVLVCLALSAGLYFLGLSRLWSNAGYGRGVRRTQAFSFAAGWAVLLAALVSPLDSLGSRLFSAHMFQHELLMIVAAPLLVMGRPLGVWAWALPPHWRSLTGALFHTAAWRVPWRVVTGPLGAWALHAVALWVWHLRALFEAALVNDTVHALQHLCFFFSAVLFWWSVVGTRERNARGVALLSLFTTMIHSGALGALLTFSSFAWYPHYAATTLAYGFSALADQQLGGLMMWIPAGLVYVIAGLALAARMLGSTNPRTVTN